MKRMYRMLLLLSLLLVACQPESDKQEEEQTAVDLKQALPGIWEAVSIHVDIHTLNNQDTNVVFEIKEENWEKVYRVRPSRTYFEPDNQFRQVFRSITDTLISESRGIWNTFGDTLMLIEPDTTYQFEVQIGGGLAEFRRQVDWDGDGQKDDDYLGVHRLVSRSTAE